jgi:hypothetical protein
MPERQINSGQDSPLMNVMLIIAVATVLGCIGWMFLQELSVYF